ncbi:hypothetical protein TRVA0_014S01024 [Trichomonascus vanleenenianus]|uniref:uncharacterized protein n=1 Tax=Trichomonascus vanleenenianus TaxID=2268995 RepID=UPI003ECB8995
MIALTAIATLLLSLCSAAPFSDKRSSPKYIVLPISPEPDQLFARYCVPVKVGDSERLAVLDTGSSDFWLPSQLPCGDDDDDMCPVATPGGLTNLGWGYVMSYADGSTANLTMYNGTLSYEGTSVETTFGIGDSDQLTAGMMGLAYSSYEMGYAKTGNIYDTVPINLRAKGAIERAAYSVSKEEIVFGGYNRGIIDEDTLVYTPLHKKFPYINHTGNVNVVLKGIYLNTYAHQKDVYNPGKATSHQNLVSEDELWVTYDTGASVTFATPEYYPQLMTIFGNNTYEAVYDATSNSTITSVPCDLFEKNPTTLTLHLENGNTFEVDAQSFVRPLTSVQGDEFCAVGVYELGGSGPRVVFGIPMVNVAPVIIDLDEERVGFARRRINPGSADIVTFGPSGSCPRSHL